MVERILMYILIIIQSVDHILCLGFSRSLRGGTFKVIYLYVSLSIYSIVLEMCYFAKNEPPRRLIPHTRTITIEAANNLSKWNYGSQFQNV
ncbi:hypothetical protein H5410_051308 [Solanum commersonii]|uniref:Uncharacterized protein n=1 Tax=Solanum commersonii TaxID=4109 RepID=A0A9J5WXU3_SOLCO|nr:hypothetical protein H5410_051308 [Solanum commersonii]